MAHTEIDRTRAFYAALRSLDLAAMFDLLSPDFEIRQSDLVPWGGDERGYGGVRRFLERFVLSVDARFDVTDIVDACDTVVTGRLRGRARATGASFDIQFVHIWRSRGERLTRLDAHVDTLALMQALSNPDRGSREVPRLPAGGRRGEHRRARRSIGSIVSRGRAARRLALAAW